MREGERAGENERARESVRERERAGDRRLSERGQVPVHSPPRAVQRRVVNWSRSEPLPQSSSCPSLLSCSHDSRSRDSGWGKTPTALKLNLAERSLPQRSPLPTPLYHARPALSPPLGFRAFAPCTRDAGMAAAAAGAAGHAANDMTSTAIDAPVRIAPTGNMVVFGISNRFDKAYPIRLAGKVRLALSLAALPPAMRPSPRRAPALNNKDRHPGVRTRRWRRRSLRRRSRS